jgi:hypothetical protein
MHSTHEAELNIPTLPALARHVHIVPALSTHSLISMGQLCDSGCDVNFDAKSVTVTHNNTTVLTGSRNPTTKLWHLNLTPHGTPQPTDKILMQAHAAIGTATPAEIVAFAHAALFSPVLSTLATALEKGYLTNFPGLTTHTLKKYPPQSPAMVKGHLDQVRKNKNSTRTQPHANNNKNSISGTPAEHAQITDQELEDFIADAFPPLPDDLERSNYCYTCVLDTTGQIFTDHNLRIKY